MSRFTEKNESHHSGSLSAQVKPIENAYLVLQRTQRGLAGMLLACAVLGNTLLKAQAGTLGNRTFLPIIISTSLLTLAYTIRNAMVLPSLSELRRDPGSARALKVWSRNNLFVQSLCAGVGLVGFAMQLFGAATPISLTLYAISLGYLFLLQPAKP